VEGKPSDAKWVVEEQKAACGWQGMKDTSNKKFRFQVCHQAARIALVARSPGVEAVRGLGVPGGTVGAQGGECHLQGGRRGGSSVWVEEWMPRQAFPHPQR